MVERTAPRHCYTSRDGESQIKLQPVMQDGRVVSFYVVVTQSGRQCHAAVTAEVNMTGAELTLFANRLCDEARDANTVV